MSSYPPTQCGLATFTAALGQSLCAEGDGSGFGVVRAVPAPAGDGGSDVVAELVEGSPESRAEAAAALNDFDVVVIQHEYGIYGGPDGDEVLAVLDRLVVPVVVVLHTVLVHPSRHQREVLEHVLAHADAVVTMTRTARRRLLDASPIAADKVFVIPHGASEKLREGRGEEPGDGRPTVLTWGLLGPGKGLEWAIEALAELKDLDPPLRYRIVGQTHPKVLEHHGDGYREGLVERARSLGVDDMVEFENDYLDTETLQGIVRDADVVLLPYDSEEQVTSGVLIEAVASGIPVVSTGFPHAVELLSPGAGLLVGRKDPGAIAAALRRILTEEGLGGRMRDRAGEIGPDLLWQSVAGRYRTIAEALLSPAARSTHEVA
ncbi:MAG TPA: glycosyltransferase [Acidimicrobiales bacterium]|nr:glycosyltransferase [Acidimicrobiales bacterium]